MAEKPPAQQPAPPEFTARGFLLNTPLYEVVDTDVSEESRKQANHLFHSLLNFDGHCPSCNERTTYRNDKRLLDYGIEWQVLSDVQHEIEIKCARNNGHRVIFFFRSIGTKLQKIGQFPSLADIANDEVRTYRSIMSADDGREFHRAVGLAAHGVGIGAFVYLRRVLERLVDRTFQDNKATENWSDTELPVRMSERITFLKNHLPDFLVNNSRIYKVLSEGIHELSEKECLAVFAVMKLAIIEILSDEQKAREKAQRRQEAAAEIQKLGSG